METMHESYQVIENQRSMFPISVIQVTILQLRFWHLTILKIHLNLTYLEYIVWFLSTVHIKFLLDKGAFILVYLELCQCMIT